MIISSIMEKIEFNIRKIQILVILRKAVPDYLANDNIQRKRGILPKVSQNFDRDSCESRVSINIGLKDRDCKQQVIWR